MEFDESKNKTKQNYDAKSTHFLTSYFKTPVIRPNISAIMKTIIAKMTPVMPYSSLISFLHRLPSKNKANAIIKLLSPPFPRKPKKEKFSN